MESLSEFRLALSEATPPQFMDLLKVSCDRSLIRHVVCILDHCRKFKVGLQIATPLRPCSERVFDLLRTYNVENCDIFLELSDEMLSCFTFKRIGRSGRYENEQIIRKFLKTSMVIDEKGIVKYERIPENQEEMEKRKLETLLFACIQCGKMQVIENVISLCKYVLNTKNDKGQTPIVCAANLQKREITLMLAKEKPDISIAANDGTLLADLIQDWDDVIQELLKVSILFFKFTCVLHEFKFSRIQSKLYEFPFCNNNTPCKRRLGRININNIVCLSVPLSVQSKFNLDY